MTLTPVKAIRAKCMDCSGGSFLEVRECPCVECPLYPYRMGHRPHKNEEPEELEGSTMETETTKSTHVAT